jgi:hypothetical protein
MPMFKKVLVGFALLGGVMAAAPASAMPVASDLATHAGQGVEKVAWYCNGAGVCYQAPRAGFFYRAVPPARYYRPPVRRTVTTRVGPNRSVTTRRTVRPNGTTVTRRTVRRY